MPTAHDSIRGRAVMICVTTRGASAAPPLGKAALERAEHAFMKQANNKGRVLESFEILTLTGWKD